MADAFHIFLKRSSLSQTRIYILPPFLVFPRVHMKQLRIFKFLIYLTRPLYSNCKSFKYTITFLCNVWLTILHWIDLHTSAPPSASSSLHDLINLAHVASLKITQQRKLLPPWKSESNWQPSWARRPGTTLPRTVTEISFAVEKLQRTYRRSSLRRSIVWIRRRSYFVGEVSRTKRSNFSACFGLLRWRITSPGRSYDESPGELLRLPSPLRHFFPLPAGYSILSEMK